VDHDVNTNILEATQIFCETWRKVKCCNNCDLLSRGQNYAARRVLKVLESENNVDNGEKSATFVPKTKY
jgi:hypothetical protein